MSLTNEERRERIKNILNIFEQRGLIEDPEDACAIYGDDSVQLRESVLGLTGMIIGDIRVLGGAEMIKYLDGPDPASEDNLRGKEALDVTIAYFRRLIECCKKLTSVQVVSG